MSTVYIRQASYEYQSLRPIVFEMLASEAAPEIRAGTRVLIKPNFLMPAEPDKAITTHPLVVKAAVAFMLDRGAKVQISDSPAMGNFHSLMRKGGYQEALDGFDVTIKPFDGTITVDVGEPFGTIDVARDAMAADVVINLAKLKTHAQMGMTLGVKNLFGCIVGLQKPEWHARAGIDRHMFAKLIVRICDAVNPDFTIVDGILAMEGQGPGKSGTPRQMGLLIGGKTPHAVDHAICLTVGLDPVVLETQKVAIELGLYDGGVHIDGDLTILNDFRFPERTFVFMGQENLSRFMRRFVIQKPVVDNDACKLCGECWKICPAQVITHTDRKISFDAAGCIRCYCCLEVCPHGAIRAKQPIAGRLWTWFAKNR